MSDDEWALRVMRCCLLSPICSVFVFFCSKGCFFFFGNFESSEALVVKFSLD